MISSQDRSVLAAADRVWQRQAKERREPWVTSEDVNEEMGIDVDQPVVEDALKRLERDGYITADWDMRDVALEIKLTDLGRLELGS